MHSGHPRGVSANEIAEIISIDVMSSSVAIGEQSIDSVMTLKRGVLVRWLYANLHAGRGAAEYSQLGAHHPDLENNATHGFEDAIISVPRVEWPRYGAEYSALGGVRVVDRGQNGFIQVPRLRPRLSPGFVFFMGRADMSESDPRAAEKGIRIYIASNDEHYTITVWRALVDNLLRSPLDASLKVVNDSRSHPRSDAIVIYCDRDCQQVTELVVDVVAQNPDSPSMSGETSLLTRRLWENVAAADQPFQSTLRKVSFGEDRCNAIAEAIQDRLLTGVDFLELLKFRLDAYHIDKNDLSRTLTHPNDKINDR